MRKSKFKKLTLFFSILILGLICYNGFKTNEYEHNETSYHFFATPHHGGVQEFQNPHFSSNSYFSGFLPEDENERNLNVASGSSYINQSSSSSGALSFLSSENKSEANETILEAYQYSGTVASNASDNISGMGMTGGFSISLPTKEKKSEIVKKKSHSNTTFAGTSFGNQADHGIDIIQGPFTDPSNIPLDNEVVFLLIACAFFGVFKLSNVSLFRKRGINK